MRRFLTLWGGIDTPLEISAQNGVISVQEKPVGPPANEIWYTSLDGNIVAPHQASSLPTIVSNTYVDGKGVIKFATNVTSIEIWAFGDCTNLTSVTIPNSVTSIEYNAFYNCTGLKTVTIGNGVTSIGSSAFWGCRSLTSITIPNSVTTIENNAFQCGYDSYTGSLETIIVGENVFTYNGTSLYFAITLGNGSVIYLTMYVDD